MVKHSISKSANRDLRTMKISVKALRLCQQMLHDEDNKEDIMDGLNRVIGLLEVRAAEHERHEREFAMVLARQRGET